MKSKKERVEYIARKLDELYPGIPIPLGHTDNDQPAGTGARGSVTHTPGAMGASDPWAE